MVRNLSHLSENPPLWLSLGFGGILILTLAVFYTALRKAIPTRAGFIFMGMILWLMVLLVLAQRRFFLNIDAVPPRFLLAIAPPLLVILGLFFTKPGRIFLDQLPIPTLTFLNTIRIPVELALYGLFVYQQIPEVMTFEGRNFDILAGITAPLAGYWASKNRPADHRKLLIWNLLALALLVNIVGHAIVSAPTPVQQLAFDQPNVGVLKFPFVGLPGLVVPMVLLGHLVSIRQLTRKMKNAPANIAF
ncbi:hypothetical protein ACS5NO_22305 [Larkinella sp. GY13]|uniref:hypothetical protein n=1 Tax=Larkinella sp. GY13 TaxID=3453720 RepID=UPI003EECB435